MSPENGHERKEKRHYTFIVLSSADSDQTRTFSVSVWGLVGTVIASFLVIVLLIFSAIVYTPIGSILPIANPELEQQYAKQIVDIQTQINTLLDQMSVLRAYNVRLRKAMGEEMHGEDSALIVSNTLKRFEQTQQQDAPLRIDETPSESVSEDQVRSPVEMKQEYSRQDATRPERANRMMDVSFSMPCEGYMTRGFDPERFHYGIDFAGKQGSSILAAANGSVVFAGWTYEDGMMMMIAHDQGYMTVYKHNRALLKNVGSTVRRGEPVAFLGNTGKTSSGPHLHFEIWRDGIAMNPMNYLMAIQ